MNRLETFFCSSSIWRRITEKQILPWLLGHSDLGEHVLEAGAGAGSATRELRRRASRVTSLEYDHNLARKLARQDLPGVRVVQGDAAKLPFPDAIFSTVVTVLMLHHLKSTDLQDRALAEMARVLQPGGRLFVMEIQDRWFARLTHWRSTFTPLDPATVPSRLAQFGFSDPRLDFNGSAFRLRAIRAETAR
jgi:ubiquinone/menaquinone biosynthesis C-methylase UbiE